jgi:hypothetical protein
MTNTYQFNLPSIGKARGLANFKVLEGDIANGKCIVLFSGNGLYFPNTEDELSKIIKCDRYEWEKLYPKNYEKIIFIRDVYKQWYIEGISTELDTVDKVKILIDEEIAGYKTTFVGSSAGGYAAVLFGNLCHADLIISLSGQFDLNDEKKREDANEILNKSLDHRYLKLDGLVNKNVVYFNPCFSKQDHSHCQLARENKHILIVEIKSSFHGVPFYPFALKKLLNLELEQYKKLSLRRHNMLIFSIRYCTWSDAQTWCLIQVSKMLKRLKNKMGS